VKPSSRSLAPFALATLSGVLYFVGFVGFDQWYLSFVCLVPLLVALGSARGWKGALALSWWMGFVTHLGGYHWIVHLLREFAHLPTSLAFLGYLLLCAAQGGILAAFGLLAWGLAKRTGASFGWTAPVALVAVELVYPLLFPSYLANALAPVPLLAQIADLGGVLLVSGLIALVNGGVYAGAVALLEKRRPGLALPATAAVALAAAVGYGAVRMRQVDEVEHAAPKLTTAIVQANVGAAEKHERIEEGIERFRRMTDEAMATPGMGLVVWPESAFNRAIPGVGTDLEWQLAGHVATPMVVGVLRWDRDAGGKRRVWNSAAAVAPGGEVTAFYDKIALLAFGEYVPGDRLFPGVYDLLPYTAHFERGASLEPLPAGPYRLSASICYEDILPRLVRQLMSRRDETGHVPAAMVNVTNDSWYGPKEPRIHLALAQFRAIEHRRWLVRSTATGISAFVDAAGRIRKRSGFETAETLVADVPMIAGGPTVYGVVGDLVGWLAVLGSALAFSPLARRRAARR
jgi:apolipoprotein N-acyltransferase